VDWIERSDYYSESNDHKYRISKAFVKQTYVYTAWRRVIINGKDALPIPLLYTRDIEAARAACENDAAL
jgi:hypothetical protein